jgi:hypothetical protein
MRGHLTERNSRRLGLSPGFPRVVTHRVYVMLITWSHEFIAWVHRFAEESA